VLALVLALVLVLVLVLVLILVLVTKNCPGQSALEAMLTTLVINGYEDQWEKFF
jgi:hypothetical protein